MLDEALRGESGDHLADAGGRDPKPLGELASRDRTLVAAEQVEGFEVVLLRPGECTAMLELLDHRALGLPNSNCGVAYHER